MRLRIVTRVTKVTIGAIGAIGAFLLLTAPASSQEDSGYSRSGLYLGANVIGGSYVRIDQLNGDPDVDDVDEVAGFGVYGGYRANPVLAFEMQFEMLTEADVDLDGAGKDGELETWTLTGNMKVFLWPERFQPYVLAGLGAMQIDFNGPSGAGVDQNDTNFVFRFGAGLDFYITEHIVASVGANYLLPAGSDVDDYDYVSYGGGIQYRF